MTGEHGAAARLSIRLDFAGGARLGPGKADLLEGIGALGSIAAAGRRMGMSYRRAWTLVEQMNAAFREPLVTRERGGAKGGGARLTAAGEAVLARYRRIEARAAEAGADEVAALAAAARDISGET